MSIWRILTVMTQRPLKRWRNARRLAAILPNGIYRKEWVTLGGVEQWITMRSADNSNPILLIVHGGPASSYIPFNPMLSEWERHFSVVQWDQRGSGRTYLRHGPDPELSIERIAQDGVELTRFISRRLGQDKIVLLASSVGSVIGARMARIAPELFRHVVATNQMGLHCRATSWRETVAVLEALGKMKQLSALQQIGSNPDNWTAEQAEKVSKLAIAAKPDAPDMVFDLMLPALTFSPDFDMREIQAIEKGMRIARDALWEELRNPDLRGKVEVPWLIVQGEADLVTPVSSARQLVPALVSPSTEIIVIPRAGHLVEFAAPDKLLEILLDRVSGIEGQPATLAGAADVLR